MVVALLDGLALHRHARPRAEADRRVITEALYALHRGFVEADTMPRPEAEAEVRL